MRRLLAFVVVPMLVLSACGDGAQEEASALPGVSVGGEFAELPTVELDGSLQLEETATDVLVEGDGDPVVRDEQAVLHLTVFGGDDGEQSLSTHDTGNPQAILVSEQQLFPPLVTALVDQPVGTRLAVGVPSEELFGDEGQPQLGIEAGEVVLFVMDILSVPPTEVLDGPEGDAVEPPENLPGVEERNGQVTGISFAGAPKEPAEDLQVVTLIEGEGPEAQEDSLVTFDYLGQVYATDKVFDESYSKEPVTFPLGVGGLIQAWDEGLVGVKRGSRVLIVAPADYAYGEQGSPPNIPGDATLVFVIDVLGVS